MPIELEQRRKLDDVGARHLRMTDGEVASAQVIDELTEGKVFVRCGLCHVGGLLVLTVDLPAPVTPHTLTRIRVSWDGL